MTSQVVVSDFHMIRPEIIRRAFDGVAEVTFADLGSVDRLVEVCERVGADGVVTDIDTPVTAEALDRIDVSVVARAAVGFDNIDVAAASERGGVVTNVPDYCTDEVATHTVALLLSAVRAVPTYDRRVRDGAWGDDAAPGRDLHRLAGRTVGFVSFGRIARRVAELTSGFGLDAVVYDPYLDEGDLADAPANPELATFESLLGRSDYVVVNAPLTAETRHLLDADAFSRMREGAVLVNTGRGAVVDEAALADALDAGELASAALDVFETEPLPSDSRLRDREDAILTPHAAWYSEEACVDVNGSAAADVRRVLQGKTPEHPVDPRWA